MYSDVETLYPMQIEQEDWTFQWQQKAFSQVGPL